MTLNEHISFIRGLIKKYDDDSIYTDQYIAESFNIGASLVIGRLLNQFRNVWDFASRSYCIGLEKSSLSQCGDCVVDCDVLRTKFKIPKPMVGRNRVMLKVMTLDRREIGRLNTHMGVSKLDPVKSSKLHYDDINGYIVIYNGKVDQVIPRAIIVEGIWENISDWENIQACDVSGAVINSYCFSKSESEFPLHKNYTAMAYSETLRLLGISLQIPEIDTPLTNKGFPH